MLLSQARQLVSLNKLHAVGIACVFAFAASAGAAEEPSIPPLPDTPAVVKVTPATTPAPINASVTLTPSEGTVKTQPIKTVGNKVLTLAGEPVLLRGLNIPSLEWNPEGQSLFRLLDTALLEWKANIIRLPVKGDFWFGRHDLPARRGADESYRWIVDQVIAKAAANGAYVLLDYHHYRAPDADTLQFWNDAATRYKNHPAVLFGLLNEPFSISWDVWLRGGPVEYHDKKKGETIRFESVGMQAVVDTVRATGARNVVVVGGLDWAYDLTGVADGYEIDPRDGHGLIYDAHVYNWKRDWTGNVLCVADKHPILVGEWGADTRTIPGTGTTADTLESPYTWVPAFLGFMQKHGLHWTAWSFHPRAGPHVIDSYHMTPTPYFGAFVRAALGGEKFDETQTR